MPDKSELAEVFKQAAEIASLVPESMQEAAFHRALDALQHRGGEVKPSNTRTGGGRHQGASSRADTDKSNPVVRLNQLSRSDAPEVDAHRGALGKSLALLRVAERELGIERLSAPQIAAVLTDKFRWKVSRRGVSKALDEAGRLVDRRKDGAGVTFRLMSPGDEWLDDPARTTGPTKQHTKRPPKVRKTPKAAAVSRGEKKSTAPSTRSQSPGWRRTSRVGPKEAVEGLILDGFLSAPRTISELRTQLEQLRALRFKPTDLSPTLVRLLRDGKLNRSKNADGQYEYITPST